MFAKKFIISIQETLITHTRLYSMVSNFSWFNLFAFSNRFALGIKFIVLKYSFGIFSKLFLGSYFYTVAL